jgi:integrative and conjugative element protein (TIGR02256 family)
MIPYVLLAKTVVDQVRRERLDRLPKETGGFLIGLRRGPHIEITDLTHQGPEDYSSHTSFERRDPKHRKKILASWRASDSTKSIVGDWHSHPYGAPEPSATDRKAWKILAQVVDRPVIGLIESGSSMPGVFLAVRRGLRFGVRLEKVEEGNDYVLFAEGR